MTRFKTKVNNGNTDNDGNIRRTPVTPMSGCSYVNWLTTLVTQSSYIVWEYQ